MPLAKGDRVLDDCGRKGTVYDVQEDGTVRMLWDSDWEPMLPLQPLNTAAPYTVIS